MLYFKPPCHHIQFILAFCWKPVSLCCRNIHDCIVQQLWTCCVAGLECKHRHMLITSSDFERMMKELSKLFHIVIYRNIPFFLVSFHFVTLLQKHFVGLYIKWDDILMLGILHEKHFTLEDPEYDIMWEILIIIIITIIIIIYRFYLPQNILWQNSFEGLC